MRRIALLVACTALAAAGPARAQDRRSVDALETWINAVKAHKPGTADRPVGFIATLKYSDRFILNPAMTKFVAAFRGDAIGSRTAEQRRIGDLFRSLRGDVGPGVFLERAAMLHADAAIFRDKLPELVDDAPPPPQPRDMRNRTLQSPLLANDLAMVHTDGRVVGQSPLNWNWTFARSLLDLLLPVDRPEKGAGHSDSGTDADRAFVAEWYHATDAYLLATGKHADLKRHLAHAAVVLPDDPHVLFDRACYAETLGLPLYQVLPGDTGYWNANAHMSMDVPAEDKTDDEAEKLFRQVIVIDPTYAEARVRLARLLERRGQYDEAAAQIGQALSPGPAQRLAYFAHLVAGRIELARGHAADAVAHYRAALAIFPDAQSALLGASQASVMSSDVAGALALVQKLGDRTAVYDADPWWNYSLGAGRDADALMAALWKSVPR